MNDLSRKIIIFVLFGLMFIPSLSFEEEQNEYLKIIEDMLNQDKWIDLIFLGKVGKIRKNIMFFDFNPLRVIASNDPYAEFKATVKVEQVFQGNKKKSKIKMSFDTAGVTENSMLSVSEEYLFFSYRSYSYYRSYVFTYYEITDEAYRVGYLGFMKKEGDYLLWPVSVYDRKAKKREDLKYIKLPYDAVIKIINDHIEKTKNERP